MELPRAVLFDLDDTLAETWQPPRPEMTERLRRLSHIVPVAIITGRDFARAEPGFLPALVEGAAPQRIFILPESAALCYQWNGTQWHEEYHSDLTLDERARIRAAIDEAVAKTRVLEGLPRFGEQLVEKRGQIAFAMLGLGVPADIKYTWDPEHEKRKALQRDLAARLPDFDVLMGGATTVDVTRKGVNKAAGVRWVAERLSLPVTEMLYIGDAIYPGGNDFVVLETGILTRRTAGPAETETIIDELLERYTAA